MPVLYVTEQQSIIRKTSDRLVVEKEGNVLMEIPCLKLDTVLIFGNVQVTTQALVEMLDHGIEQLVVIDRRVEQPEFGRRRLARAQRLARG